MGKHALKHACDYDFFNGKVKIDLSKRRALKFSLPNGRQGNLFVVLDDEAWKPLEDKADELKRKLREECDNICKRIDEEVERTNAINRRINGEARPVI